MKIVKGQNILAFYLLKKSKKHNSSLYRFNHCR
nr:MAG TPA: hypothetical protein [Caudoviricetes sp.]